MPHLLKDWRDSNTVTVQELINELLKYDGSMAVAYTWEGQVLPVVLDKIEVMEETSRVFGPVLLLDAEL